MPIVQNDIKNMAHQEYFKNIGVQNIDILSRDVVKSVTGVAHELNIELHREQILTLLVKMIPLMTWTVF